MRPSHHIQAVLDRFREVHQPPRGKLSWQVEKLLECIHREMFDSTLSVAGLRTRCNLRDNNVSCAFKREMGVSIKAYLETLRLRAALLLLENPTLSAAEVSWYVGYQHLPTFYRAFARHYRCTPGDARGRVDLATSAVDR